MVLAELDDLAEDGGLDVGEGDLRDLLVVDVLCGGVGVDGGGRGG